MKMSRTGKKFVKKSNSLISADYSLSLAEQRMLLLVIAGEQQLSSSSRYTVTAESYASCYGVTQETAYEALASAATRLFERRYTIRTERRVKLRRWVSGVDYLEGEGLVELHLSPDVLPYLTQLSERFTVYQLEQVAGLTSSYALRLYELLAQWRSVGKTPLIPLADFRAMLGVEPGRYREIAGLKRRVLDVALAQINEHTDITAAYEQHKRGRSISAFSFTFTEKKSVASDSAAAGDTVATRRKTITKAQAAKMARVGEGWPELYKRLSRDHVIKG